MSRSDYEDQLSFATAQYLDLRGLLYTHFPAGEHRHARTGAKLKRMGLKRGVPDYLVFRQFVDAWSDGRDWVGWEHYVGLAIELKSPKGRQTKDQKRWQAGLEDTGWRYEICRTIEDVVRVVEDCYGRQTKTA